MFHNTDLAEHLAELRYTQVVITGITTSVSGRTSAIILIVDVSEDCNGTDSDDACRCGVNGEAGPVI